MTSTDNTYCPNPGEIISLFKQRNFEVTEFIGDAATKGNEHICTLANTLDESLAQIRSSLHAEVVVCNDRLLDNTFKFEVLERGLVETRTNVDTLKSLLAEIKDKCLVPFRQLKRKVMLLDRAQAVNVLIRRYMRFEFDFKKLKAHVENQSNNNMGQNLKPDYAKAAYTIRDLEAVISERSLNGIASLQRNIDWIRAQGDQLRRRAGDDLRLGIRDSDQGLIDTSTQAFFNLNCLWDKLQSTCNEIVDFLAEKLLPLSKPLPNASVTSQQLLEPFIIFATTSCRQIYFLDSVLVNKTDPLTHKKFVEQSVLLYFWERLFPEMLREKISKASPTVTNLLVADLPNVSKMLQFHFLDNLEIHNLTLWHKLFEALDDVHGRYATECLSRVIQPVDLMLPEKNQDSIALQHQLIDHTFPTPSDLRRYVQILCQELDRVWNQNLPGAGVTQQQSVTGTATQNQTSVPGTAMAASFLILSVIRTVRSSIASFLARIETLASSIGPRIMNSSEASKTDIRNAKLYCLITQLCALLRDNLGHSVQDTLILPSQFLSSGIALQRQLIAPVHLTITNQLLTSVAPTWSPQLLRSNTNLNSQQVVTVTVGVVSPPVIDFVNFTRNLSKSVLIPYMGLPSGATSVSQLNPSQKVSAINTISQFLNVITRGVLMSLFYSTVWTGNHYDQFDSNLESNNINNSRDGSSHEHTYGANNSTGSGSSSEAETSEQIEVNESRKKNADESAKNKIKTSGNLPVLLAQAIKGQCSQSNSSESQLKTDLNAIQGLILEICSYGLGSLSVNDYSNLLELVIKCIEVTVSPTSTNEDIKQQVKDCVSDGDTELKVAVSSFVEAL